MFADRGCLVIDADQVVAELYKPGASGHAAIVQRYGPEVLRADGEIDRSRLSGVALANDASARELNNLIHPLVIERISKMIEQEDRATETGGGRIAVVEATLLLESGMVNRYDRLIVVDIDPAIQLERAIGRGMTRQEAERRIARQMGREERLRHADFIIENDGDFASTDRQVQRVHEALLEDLAGSQ